MTRSIALPLALCTLWATAASAAPGAMAFEVDVSLSPAAAARMATLSERIVVSASYFGDPTPSAIAKADQVGQIDLGRETVELPATGGHAAITGRTVRPARIAWVAKGEAQVNVNVFSARLSRPDNLLDCGYFQDTVHAARQAPVKLACKLIGER